MKRRMTAMMQAAALASVAVFVGGLACTTGADVEEDEEIASQPGAEDADDDDFVEPELWADDPEQHFEKVEAEFESWDRLVIEGDVDEQGQSLDEKLDGLEWLIAEYEQVTDHGDDEWTAAAYYRIADMLQRTAQELFVAPIPFDEDTEEYWAYQDQLDDLGFSLEMEALERYEDLLWWAADRRVENEWVARAMEQMKLFVPAVIDDWIEEFPHQSEFVVGHYQSACDDESALACGDLAQLYRDGEWVDEDLERSVELFEKACHLDAAECVNLGMMYVEGQGVDTDEERAGELFERSCEAGDVGGCMELAARYEEGIGVEEDGERAHELYEAACGEGAAEACERVEASE